MPDKSRFSEWALQGRNPAIFPVAGPFNEIREDDDETVIGDRADGIDSANDHDKDPSNPKTGDYVVRVEEDRRDEDPELQHGQVSDEEAVEYWRRRTAASGKNWLLILLGFLSAYSMYNYSEGIPEEDRIFIDWFLKWAMGPFWKPTTGCLVVVILIYIATTCVLVYRQGFTPFLMIFIFSGSFGHLMVAVWRGDWANALLADTPLRLNIAVFFLQIFITVQHRSGRGISRATLLQEVRKIVAQKKDDYEAQRPGREDANVRRPPDGDQHRGEYGAC